MAHELCISAMLRLVITLQDDCEDASAWLVRLSTLLHDELAVLQMVVRY